MQLKNDNISQAHHNAEVSAASAASSVPLPPQTAQGEVPPLPPRLRSKAAPQTPPKPTNLQATECELSVYKSVPVPRQLAEGPTDATRRGEHPLSGSEPVLTELAGRLNAVSTQVTRLSAPEGWHGGTGTVNSPTAPTSSGSGATDPTAANGRLAKKYHHLRDMFSNRFSRSGDSDGRSMPLSAAPEHGGEHGAPPASSAAGVASARGAPLRSSVRSLAAEEVSAAAAERQLWAADGQTRGRVASLGARYGSVPSTLSTAPSALSVAPSGLSVAPSGLSVAPSGLSVAPSGLSVAQRPLTNGSPAGEQPYGGYPPSGREYHPHGYHEQPEYPHTSAAAPASGGPYSVPPHTPRPGDPRPQRPPVAFPGGSPPVRPAGYASQPLRAAAPAAGQPRPPPPAYGTRLPPPGHYLSRQGSQGRPPVDSPFSPGRPSPPAGAATTTVTARPAVSSGPHQEAAATDRSRAGEVPRSQPSTDHRHTALLDTSVDSEGRARAKPGGQRGTHNTGNDQEWADTEPELRQILDPGSRRPDLTSAPAGVSSTPPLPAPDGSPPHSPAGTPRLGTRAGQRSAAGPNQPDLLEDTAAPGQPLLTGRIGSGSAPRQGRQSQGQSRSWVTRAAKESPTMGRGDPRERSRQRTTTRVGSLGVLGPANDSGGDLASLDLESALDQTSDQSTDDSTVLETGVDGPTVRRQLQSLETMYSEVLRLLGGQKRAQPGRPTARVPAGRLRPGSSVSSLPSSIGGKPSRDRRRDDRKQTRDSRGINKRFQRLESHVVTLARSVAHLSSEMRTQHLMFQEMESIRTELAQLRQGSGPGVRHGGDFGTFRPAGVSLTHPPRVRKLTRFFGDEPPLLRIFLNQLGYEKYAPLFERERIGMLELPYMTEERLQKLGVPIGPRLRILHEAQLSMRGDNPNVYIL